MLVKNTLLICIAALLLGCNACHNTTPIFPKDDTNENERNNRLFVFVGKKIAIQNEPYVRGSLDNGFTAKYKVLQRVYGNYEKDTIEFTAYDHYGIPAFSKYKNVLLFVSEYEGNITTRSINTLMCTKRKMAGGRAAIPVSIIRMITINILR